jgi:hypothetical protein
VEVDEKGRMKVEHLHQMILADKEKGMDDP